MAPGRLGEMWAGLAALSFVGFELAQRLAAPAVAPMAGAFVRALPLVVASWGFLVLRRRLGGLARIGWGGLLALLLVGAFDFVVGNALKLLAFRTGGISVSLPLLEAGNLIGAAALAAVVVRQPLRVQLLLGLAVMVLGGIALGLGSPALAAWDIAVPSAVGAGLAFAAALAFTAYVLARGVSLAEVLAVSSAAGLLILAAVMMAGGGLQLGTIRPVDALSLLASGGLNGLALYCLSRAVVSIDVGRANAICATNSALAAALGAIIFGESPGALGWLGIALIFAGAFLARSSFPGRAEEPAGAPRTTHV